MSERLPAEGADAGLGARTGTGWRIHHHLPASPGFVVIEHLFASVESESTIPGLRCCDSFDPRRGDVLCGGLAAGYRDSGGGNDD